MGGGYILQRSFRHLEEDLLCAVGFELSGADVTEHDIISIAFVPLGLDLNPDPKIMPLILTLQPRFPDRWNTSHTWKKRQEYQTGMDQLDAARQFDLWAERIKSPQGKIQLVGYQIGELIPFLIQWLGPFNYTTVFSPYTRDLHSIAAFIVERALFKNDPSPFRDLRLKSIKQTVNVSEEIPREPTQQALAYARIYERMLRIFLN